MIAPRDFAADSAPGSVAISVLTLGELRAGVQLARDSVTRRARRARLERVRSTFTVLGVDEEVAERYGEILAVARMEKRLAKASDLLIIATAAIGGRMLFTLDERQARLASAAGVTTSSSP